MMRVRARRARRCAGRATVRRPHVRARRPGRARCPLHSHVRLYTHAYWQTDSLFCAYVCINSDAKFKPNIGTIIVCNPGTFRL